MIELETQATTWNSVPSVKSVVKRRTTDFTHGTDACFDQYLPSDIEVLSPDTERIDRGEKLRNYQALPSREAYILEDQFHIAVAIYRRVDGEWTSEFLTEKTDVIPLPGIGCELPLTAVYERTHLVR